MKSCRFSNVVMAGVVCILLQAIPVLADSSQWSQSNGSTTTSRNLHWANPKTSVKPVSGVITMNQQIAVSYPASAIQQVQYQQPNPATPLTTAQQDLVYPEKRPQSKTPPSGATSTPLAPSNPTFQSRPQETVTDSTPQQRKSSSAHSSNSSENNSDQNTSTVTIPTPKLQKQLPTEIQNPPMPAETKIQSGTVPAPTPNDTFASGTSTRGIVCPDKTGFKSIKDISFDIRPMPGELPKECPLITNSYNGRHFAPTCYQWKASGVCTKAAYFEDVQLERYGHSVCPFLQPVISGTKFFLTVPLLPYKMGITPPNECVYTLGHYRVGNCSPYMLDPFPISVRAVLFEAAAVGGAVALIP
ncbi:MAG: hypothetical protein LBC02_09890 [Planctomycetaceae bacterium]|jgi:hypothetical protein|nr:hypothetical protein [Planctomycetaceae bacterium]